MEEEKRRTAAEKGNALEEAVGLIESLILSVDPGASEKAFTIEYKKILVVDGVRHEMDLYVTVHFAPGYQSIFIFECKNWAEPVGKNEIIIFSEKVKAVGAAHGYFVATAFTADAKAQAKKDNRLTLRYAVEHDPLQTLSWINHYDAVQRYYSLQIEIYAREGQVQGPTSGSLQVQYNGDTTDFHTLLIPWARDQAREPLKHFASERAAGVYDFDVDFVRVFFPGNLRILGEDIDLIHVLAKTTVEIYRAPLASSFEIESRGKVISWGALETPSVNIGKSYIAMADVGNPTTSPQPQSLHGSSRLVLFEESSKSLILSFPTIRKPTGLAPAERVKNVQELTGSELADLVSRGEASFCIVSTSPTGAEVYLDGKQMGVSELVFCMLKSETPRTITIKMDGYKTLEGQCDPNGRTVVIAGALEKQ